MRFLEIPSLFKIESDKYLLFAHQWKHH
jgi:hypothetical protein